MKKLLGVERHGALITKDWLHYGDHGQTQITTQTTQDVDPVMAKVKETAQTHNRKDSKFVGSVPFVMVDDFCQKNAKNWGVKPRDVLRELVQNKTDRAKAFWANQLKGRDYRKLQAKNY